MAELAKKHTERLPELKKSIEEAHQYFEDNTQRYNQFMKFVFKTSLSDDETATLADIGMPTIEFNILEAFISRLRGEFAKQQPALTVRAADGVPLSMLTEVFTATIEVIEAHLRAIFFDGANDMMEYNIYSDLLGGGFSVMRVFTDYVNEMSFEQTIKVERAFDPTLCVFDPIARESHKGDGRFCAELYPMTRRQFEEEYGKEAANDMKFTRELSGYDWSFKNEEEEIVLVCDYYEKQKKPAKIYKLSNGHVCTDKEYEELLKHYSDRVVIEQPPAIVNQRKTILETICRYRFCESKVLGYVETNYKMLPLVFVDGNSVTLKEGGAYYQMTRPYVYHAQGIQRLKNYAGQSLGRELENTVQNKWIAAIESIPVDYQDAYQNPQKPDTLVYHQFMPTKNGPNFDIPLAPPQAVARTPIPPEISQTFRMTDEMTQIILGSYDSAAGVNSASMSGVAFARSAIQSNNASVPYIVGYIKGLNRVAQIIVDLIPKYYRTPRSLPILLPSGKREYITINKMGSLYMNYDPNSLQVKVETGVNFAMQKEIALQTITTLMQASPLFAQFMNQDGLQTLLDNIDIRGIEELKSKAEAFEQQLKQQQQMQMQAQQAQAQAEQQQAMMNMMQVKKQLQSPTPEEVGMMAIKEKAKTDAANVAIKEQEAETKFLDVMNKIRSQDVEHELKAAEIEAEQARTAVDAAISISSHINESMGAKDER